MKEAKIIHIPCIGDVGDSVYYLENNHIKKGVISKIYVWKDEALISYSMVIKYFGKEIVFSHKDVLTKIFPDKETAKRICGQ